MRLGQLARKYGVSPQEIISFIKEVEPDSDQLGENSKLSEQLEAMVSHRFDDAQPVKEDPEIAPQPDEDSESSASPANDAPQKPDVVIETDKLLELLESEETSNELEKITLIKAPKKELEGLKIKGKIELPDPKEKLKSSEHDDDPSAATKTPVKPRKARLSYEEKEKKRVEARKRKLKYMAREKKRRQQQEQKQKKKVNRAHYQQKIQQHQANKLKKPKGKPVQHMEQTPAPPPTMLGKLWRWLTTF